MLEAWLDLWEGDSIMPGYGWIFPLHGDVVNVGAGLLNTFTRAAEVAPKDFFGNTRPDDPGTSIDIGAPQRAILDALEANHPALLGTMRDAVTKKRRPMIRFFACEEDLSDESPDVPVPDEVATGKEPFLIIGAIAGG